MCVELSLLESTCSFLLLLLLLHTAWTMTCKVMLAVKDLHGEDKHGWPYGFRVEKLLEGNMAPIFGLVAALQDSWMMSLVFRGI